MNLKVSLILGILTIMCLHSSDCFRNVSAEFLELKDCIEESRNRIEQTVSLLREDFRRHLDTVLDDLGYLKKREKMVELCQPRRCALRRKCVLSDDMETSYCVCQDGYGGYNCELTTPCLIDQYNYEKDHDGEKFPYKCTDRGYYQRVQFNETGGYCVTEFNEVLAGYHIDSPDDVNAFSCNCAIHKYIRPPSLDMSVCKSNGEFDTIACYGDICSCQSKFGDLSEKFNSVDIDQWYSTCEKLNEIYDL